MRIRNAFEMRKRGTAINKITQRGGRGGNAPLGRETAMTSGQMSGDNYWGVSTP